jgi:hypothetical protein
MRSRDRRLAKTAAWACSNLIRGAKGPEFASAAEIGMVALRALASSPLTGNALSGGPTSGSRAPIDALGIELATEMAWVLSMITSGSDEVCAPLVDAGAFVAAVRGLSCGHMPLITPCLRVLGNLMGLQLAYLDLALAQPALLPSLAAILLPHGDDEDEGGSMEDDDADLVLIAGLVPPTLLPEQAAAVSVAPPIRPHFRMGHIKEALWVVSNLLGGSGAHAAAVLASPAWQWSAVVPPDATLPLPLVHILVEHLTHSAWPVRVEAAMCFANLCMQRAAVVPIAVATQGGSSAMPRRPLLSSHPFLAVVLHFDAVLREFMSLLQGACGGRPGLLG